MPAYEHANGTAVGAGWSARSDAEQVERAGAGQVPPGPAHGLGDVAPPGQAQQADRQVPQARQDLRAAPGTDLTPVRT